MVSEFRSLSADEIVKLTGQGCSCDDWSNVQVAKGFNAGRVRTVHFSGRIKLGVFEKQVSFAGGVARPAGISNAAIHNCRIGDNVYISQVRSYIANYIIEDDVVIENVDLLAVGGKSSFGNGVEAAVVNEAGGREIPIYDNLSAHTAYIMAFYRHRPGVIEKLREMIASYSRSVTSSMGLVAARAKLINCRVIKNVKVGADAVIEGVDKLENGSVNSSPEDPAYIGPAVIAEDFIACAGSKISEGAVIRRCFVGQAAILGGQYSAESSVFFANCQCLQGEACAVFAGPYTVTHHKSTLLIAGLFSFMNAGSGTNQSNHIYKLGPVHQGVVERGSKTGSDSYILWPARIGAFSVVVGRHYGHPDTCEFPFSYLIEFGGESILTPGNNLRKIGLIRDGLKWPKRDRRKSTEKLDLISFKVLSPYTIQKVLRGCQLLAEHRAGADAGQNCLACPGVTIRSSSVDNGIKLYEMAVDQFLGDCFVNRLEGKFFKNIDELREALSPQTETGTGNWVDLAGLLAPQEALRKMLDDIENGSISSLEQAAETFQSLYDNYSEYEWTFAADLLRQRLNKTISSITTDDIAGLIAKWKTAIEKFERLRLADGQKEYTAVVRTGYGLDGDERIRDADFDAVRGTFEENSFLAEIEEYTAAKLKLGEELISRLKKLR